MAEQRMSTTQMFIGNLPWSIRAHQLEEDFGAFGEVTDAFVAYEGRRSRGFAFVTMAKPEEAAKAQAALDGKKVGEGEHEREMRVTFAQERSAEEQAKADAAKEAAVSRRNAAVSRRNERTNKKQQGKKKEGEEKEAAKEGEGKAKGKTRKRNPKGKGKGKGGGGEGGKPAKEDAKKEVKNEEATAEEKKAPDWHAEKIAKKLAEAPPVDEDLVASLRAKAQNKTMTEEEKKARGLLYDTSKASAVRNDDDDDDDDESANIEGGDPFAGLDDGY